MTSPHHKKEEYIVESRVKYEPPAEGSNMARELLAAFRRHSGRVLLTAACEDGKPREWTGERVLLAAGRVACGLVTKAQVKPNQTVALFCEHSADEVIFALGVILAGGALLGQEPSDGYDEILTSCRLVAPDVIVVNANQHQMAAQLRRDVNPRAAIVWLDNPISEGQIDGSAEETTNNNNADPAYHLDLIRRDQVLLAENFEQFDEQLLDRIAVSGIDPLKHIISFMQTSGSTGRAKMVASTHKELVYGLYSMISATRNSVEGMPAGSYLLPVNEQSVLAGDLPIDHGAGLYTMFMSLCIGSNFVVMPSYNVEAFWQAIHDYGVTSSISSTTFTYKLLTRLRQLVADGQADKWDLSRFEWLSCCGSKLAFTDLVKEIRTHYKHLHIVQGYGATEVGFMSMLLKSDCDTHLNSTGHLFPGLKAKLVDRSSDLPISLQDLRAGAKGELHVWAESKFREYRCHMDDDAGKLVADCHDQENFYKTGDQVNFDFDGRMYIYGRFKDTLFLTQDWKILPSELEDIIVQHVLVDAVAVIGIPDVDNPGCDAPRAFVKLISQQSPAFKRLERENHPAAEQITNKEFVQKDVAEFLAKQVAACKQLKGGVRIVDDFPRNGVLNKIDRKALKLID